MRLRAQFLLFVLILHGLFFLLSLQFLPETPLYFFLVETAILFSLGFSYRLYRSFIAPLDLIKNGIEVIKAQDFNTRLRPVNQSEMDQLIDVYNQMNEQLRLERVKQQEQEFLLDKLIEASPAGIIVLEFDGQIRSLNPVAVDLLGLPPGQKPRLRIAELPGEFARQLDQLKPGETRTLMHRGGRSFKCQRSHFLDRGFNRHFLILEELTEELLKREKQTYGKIIRFMSHEISNSIGAINSILNSLLHYGDQLEQGDVDDFQGAIAVATTRNDHLNTFMQHYAQIVRLPTPVKEKQDLHEVLRDVEKLFSVECQRLQIVWEWDLETQRLICEFDMQQLEQALTNIIKNAMEAMESGGVIGIQTRVTPVKTLRITDTGSGFTEEAQASLFTPFFSTKKNGQGVGLIMIRDILKNHGFGFSLQRNADQKTEFLIELS